MLYFDNMKTKETIKGWVVICENHPRSGLSFIVSHTFRETRRESIDRFLKPSLGETWRNMRRKYNFKCVKAENTIDIDPPYEF